MIAPVSASEPAIEVQNLHKSYGENEAVRGLDFRVERGEVFGLLGPNGAGKTTTVEILEGYRAADLGRGQRARLRPPAPRARAARAGGDRAPGRWDLPPDHGREAVSQWAGFYPTRRDVDEVIELAGLAGKESERHAPALGRAAPEAGLRAG